MKKYKVITITQKVTAGEENSINWAATNSSLHEDLQNGWEIEQTSTTSPSDGQISLTLVLISVTKDYDLEDV